MSLAEKFIKDFEQLPEHKKRQVIDFVEFIFIMAVGISYLPLHEEAMKIAQEVGKVDVTNCQTNNAAEYIQNAADKGRLGFKRKNVRC